MALFRQIVLKNLSQATLSILRFKGFALGEWITKHTRITSVKINATEGETTMVSCSFGYNTYTNTPLQVF